MKKAFTLIELLIVVAIIAILAAIAVPNFLEAQTRSKVARCKADMRTLTTALESYGADSSKYPPHYYGLTGSNWNGASVFNSRNTIAVSGRFIRLTSPIAYITSIPQEAFTVGSLAAGTALPGDKPEYYDTYDYFTDQFSPIGRGYSGGGKWRVAGVGPDRKQAYGGTTKSSGAANPSNAYGVTYDATNGTISSGDIIRVGPPSSTGTEEPFFNRATNPNL
ncbi:MAG: prepilin-type N-terminal cleavage/methylation domain-containing protein [bacterium]